MSINKDNDGLVDELKENGFIKSEDLESLFRAVDRRFYFLPKYADRAYTDLPWREGTFHISAPCIYGTVMENLNLRPGLSFLNIGSGTGYLSTMAGLLLGPYGVNHGVEIHAELIDYASRKLEEFWRSSPAIDAYEFCEPIFVKGNCLCLLENSRLYDRVYCGAACPETHEVYMQNLIKVGGVLVMPINDKLLRITRTSETTWESVNVLPVSYATLQDRLTEDRKQLVVLPYLNPLSLQELCRSVIRMRLRKEVESKHPGLSVSNKVRRSTKRKRGVKIMTSRGCYNISMRHGIDNDAVGVIVPRRSDARDVEIHQTEDSRESTDSESQSEEDGGRRKSLKIDLQPDESNPLENNIINFENAPRNDGVPVYREVFPTIQTPHVELYQDEANTYSALMREKIMALPIPRIVQDFLNYHRPF